MKGNEISNIWYIETNQKHLNIWSWILSFITNGWLGQKPTFRTKLSVNSTGNSLPTCMPPGSSALWSSILEFCVRAMRSKKSIVFSDSRIPVLAAGLRCESQYNGSSTPLFFGLRQESMTPMIPRRHSYREWRSYTAPTCIYLWVTIWKDSGLSVNKSNCFKVHTVAVNLQIFKENK